MKNGNKSRTKLDNLEHNFEFSPGQLIVAICTILAFGVVCFMLGIMVNKLDQSFTSEQSQVAAGSSSDEAQDGGGDTDEDASPDGTGAGTQSSPTPFESIQNPDTSREDKSKSNGWRDSSTRRVVTLGPPAAKKQTPGTESGEPAGDGAVNAGEGNDGQPTRSRADTKTASRSSDQTGASKQPAQGQAQSGASGQASQELRYGVQVIAFSPDNQARATRYVEDIQARTNHPAHLIPSTDNKLLRVIVGEFEERAEADQLKNTLKESGQFEGVFVQDYVL